MELGNILEFRKDLYFEGAVQADWFYTPEKAAKVAENLGITVPDSMNDRAVETFSEISEG